MKPISLILYGILPLAHSTVLGCTPHADRSPDRCGPNMQLTPTSNFCVSIPNEITKIGGGYFMAKKDIRGALGGELCIVQKDSYLTLLPPGGVIDGQEAALFAGNDGCVVRLAFRLRN
jgi:hypothetical protein